MIRPAFQFYPGDWRGNAKLRRCSEAARGAWIDVLCVLHDADEYGVCRWPLRDLTRAAGVSMRSIQELTRNAVLKGADHGAEPFVYTPRHAGKDGEPVALVEAKGGPVWYSSRFVRDEHVRQRRGASTQFTSESQPPKRQPKATPNHGFGERQGDGASSSASSSKDQKLPTSSERKALDEDPVKSMIDGAVTYMASCGIGEKQARSVIGMTRKAVGDTSAAELLTAMQQQRIAAPAGWLRKAAEGRHHASTSIPDFMRGAI